MNLKLTIYIFILLSCVGKSQKSPIEKLDNNPSIKVGALSMDEYLPVISDKNIALVVNQTSMVNGVHLVDSLIDLGINIKCIFSPEHGFRGEADAGELVNNSIDTKTGIPIVSLYGKNKKPTNKQLDEIDIVVFDIQDVGVRFYTYISTLHYIMEACSANGIKVIVLDRPNPNGYYVDGPLLKEKFKSFIGMHPVPVVYGLTIGEYANMINGEQWLSEKRKCDLNVVKLKNYSHDSIYELPIKPSPNLPNLRSILLYPSLCFFEGTSISVGRGTDFQFQHIGHPDLMEFDYHFTPKSNLGAKHPKHENEKCFGIDFKTIDNQDIINTAQINLELITDFYKKASLYNIDFFARPDFFDLLAGTDELRLDIENELSVDEIRSKWKMDLNQYNNTRERYLLYR